MFLRNEKGQMAIFIALFFQVLFVFFAMAINVGMVVHDKINLQNAVDIAAYYGAMKQAETLNQIAHVNYQMRQNYKLFVWRYWALGNLGTESNPYSRIFNPNYFGVPLNAEQEFNARTFGDPNNPGYVPVVCALNDHWFESDQFDPGASFCRAPLDLPNFPPAVTGPNFVPGAGAGASFNNIARQALQVQCNEASIMNWALAARFLTAYRADGFMRKRKIARLARNLCNGVDLRTESIEEGARKTFLNNLTNGNYSGGASENFQFINSITRDDCEDTSYFLPEIQILPVIAYSDRNGNDISRCEVTFIPNYQLSNGRTPVNGSNNLPTGFQTQALYNRYAPQYSDFIQHWGGEPPQESGYRSSVGFEKNPWQMVYAGVEATTQVRKPFSPTGATVTLRARGYAKPFGGRIGPWYGKNWPSGSPTSVGSTPDEKVDRLLPNRNINGSNYYPDLLDNIANFSRFPGDTLGMRSARAFSALSGPFRQAVNSAGVSDPLAWSQYDHVGAVASLEQNGDSAARDNQSRGGNGTFVGRAAIQRPFEIAAMAPDVFDAFYYSIEPEYFNNYYQTNSTNGGPTFADSEKIYDFGSSKDGYANSPVDYSVTRQIAQADQQYPQPINYVIREWASLLTSWHQNRAVDFSFDNDRFGNCFNSPGSAEFPTTGNCISGGRTGYSVKMISHDYLCSSEHALGGASGETGPIANPPTCN